MATRTVQHIQDAAAIAAALFGTFGALYGAYALYREMLQRFTTAATTALASACIAGLTVGVPALDAAFSPYPGVISAIIGIVVWELYGFFLFVITAAPSLETLDDPAITAIPPWRRSQMQPAEIAAWLWFRIAWVGGLGWGEIAFSIAPQRNYILAYLLLTMMVGGAGGFVVGYSSRPPAQRPPLFAFTGAANAAGVVTILLTALIVVATGIRSYLAGSVSRLHLPPSLAAAIYVMLIPIPVLIVAMGFSPFARWKMNTLSERQYGLIGIWMVLAAFLMQLVPPLLDVVETPAP